MSSQCYQVTGHSPPRLRGSGPHPWPDVRLGGDSHGFTTGWIDFSPPCSEKKMNQRSSLGQLVIAGQGSVSPSVKMQKSSRSFGRMLSEDTPWQFVMMPLVEAQPTLSACSIAPPKKVTNWWCLEYVSVCMYACMYACMHGCMDVCVYVCTYVCT